MSFDSSATAANTTSQIPHTASIPAVFHQQAKHTPQAPALYWEDHCLTYEELQHAVLTFANRLQEQGIGPENRIALLANRSAQRVVAILATLHVGAAYVPLDPSTPAQRLQWLLKDADVSGVWHDEDLDVANAPAPTWPLVMPQTDGPQAFTEPLGHADSIAYLCYTSGTTGNPKAAMIPHRAVLNLVRSQPSITYDADHVWLDIMAPAFDPHVHPLFGALLHGGALALLPSGPATPLAVGTAIKRYKVTSCTFVTSVFHAIADLDPRLLDGMTQCMIGGEVLSPQRCLRILAEYPELRISNVYGPTEACVFTTAYQVTQTDDPHHPLPIGKPIPGTTYAIRDPEGRDVPMGTTGELYLGGDCVATGYWQRPALNAEAFPSDPEDTSRRFYRTGDLAICQPDGNLRFVGRLDDQVKINGYRIEPAEVATTLAGYPDIGPLAVSVRHNPVGEKALVAWITEPMPDPAEMKAWLGEQLPPYMLPNAFVEVPSLPETSNQKIDIKALPDPQWREASGLPKTPEERALAEIWQEVLDLESIYLEDDLFALGVNSLFATKISVRIRERFHCDLPLLTLFENPKLVDLAAILQLPPEGQEMPAAFTPVSRDQNLPLSYAQERVWFIEQLNPESKAYSAQFTLRFRGKLQVPLLRQALDEVIVRHESFRTTFELRDGEPCQIIHDPWKVDLPVLDFRNEPDPEAALDKAIAASVHQGFDMGELPLVRWLLARLDDEEYLLHHIEHHMIHDGWSGNVFVGEVLDLYRAFHGGQPSPLEPLPIQFGDFAWWERRLIEPILEEHLDWWASKLKGAPPFLELPTDRPRPVMQTHKGSNLRFALSDELYGKICALMKTHNVTLFHVLLAAFTVHMSRHTGMKEFCLGSGVANRSRRETESLIGMVINTVTFRQDISHAPTFDQLLREVRQTTLEAFAHQDVPVDRVVEALGLKRSLSYNPLYQVAFSMHDSPAPALDLPELDLEWIVAQSNGSAKLDLNVIVIPRVGVGATERPGVTMLWEYSSDLFERQTVLDFHAHYLTLLEAFVADPHTPIEDVQLLGDADRRLLLEEGQGKTLPITDSDVYSQIRNHGAMQPDTPAISDQKGDLSYAELVKQSGQLAAHLRSQGAAPGQIIAVLLGRSRNLIIAQLAAFDAGAAFLPLDERIPPARLAFILADAGVERIITESRFLDALADIDITTVNLDEPIPSYQPQAPQTIDPQSLAYVIYTSGSTGNAKGVRINHHGLTNLCAWYRRTYGLQPGERMSQTSSPAFDASILEIYNALSSGLNLVFISDDIKLTPERLQEEALSRELNHLWVTTAIAEGLFHLPWPEKSSLRYLYFGGEKMRVQPPKTLPFQLVSLYGPTEITVLSSGLTLFEDGEELILGDIGRPIDNFQHYILDERRELLPCGVPGELCIAGAGVADGYLGHAADNTANFVNNPFGPGKLYCTGDRVRRLPDGRYQYLGRLDHQVKLRGLRIEMGEIEVALNQSPLVQHAVCSVWEDKHSRRLVAHLVPSGDDAQLEQKLRDHLAERLPDYMIPSNFIYLKELPLNKSGKVNRFALPEPTPEAGETFVSPRNEQEQTIAAIWCDVLGLDQVSITANFFELGGHSLNAGRIMGRINAAFSTQFPLKQIFNQPTIAQLAQAIKQTPEETGPKLEASQPDAAALLEQMDDLNEAEMAALLSDLEAGGVA